MPRDATMQSLQRAVHILYAVAGVEDGCTVQQIAHKTGLKPNTVYKFTRSLERERLLKRRTSPLRFVLGHTLTELKRLDDERHLLSEARRLLLRCQTEVRDGSFTLCELEQTVFYKRLYIQHDRPGVPVQLRESSNPLYEKATSLLFLAYCPPNVARALYQAHPFETEGKPFWGTRKRLESFLAQVRQRGYCQPEIPDSIGDIFRVAAPVFSRGHEMIAAIGAHLPEGPAGKRDQARLVRVCCAAARELTEQVRPVI